MKRKIGYSLIILGIFAMFTISQITTVSALSTYSDEDTYNWYYGDGHVYMKARVTIWAGPKTGGGAYMNHQDFWADLRVENAYGLWARITHKIQGVTYFYDYVYNPETKEWDPETIYNSSPDYYVYKSNHLLLYAEMKVELRWESAGHVEWQHNIELYTYYEVYN